MVVIAVGEARNADHSVSPAAAGTMGRVTRRVLVKLVVAAGIAAAGWLLAGALGGGTASADDSPLDIGHSPSHIQRTAKGDKQPQGPGLVGTLTGGVVNPVVGTVGNVTGTVTGALPQPLGTTLQNTVTKVTGTVTAATGQLAATADGLVRPIAGGLVQPIVDQVVAPVIKPVTTVLTPAPAHRSTKPAVPAAPSAPTSPATPPAAPAQPPAPQAAATQTEPATVVVKDAALHQASARTAAQLTDDVQRSAVHADGKSGQPAPLPDLPGGDSGTATPAHDNGGTGKSAPEGTSSVATASRFTSPGLSTGHALDDNSREAALPTTSPD